MRVLFIGNSHTFFNDMPELFARFCETDGAKPDVTMLAYPGRYLDWHMDEYFASAESANFVSHSVAQGREDNFLVASAKKMIIGAVAGAVIACGLWFLAALAPEFRKKKDEPGEGKEAARA